MSYYDELAEAGYRDVTGCRVYSLQPSGELLLIRYAIGQPADLCVSGTWYESGKLRSIILDCGTVLVAGLHGPAEPLSARTLRELAPRGKDVFYLLPSLARGDLVIKADTLAACRPLTAPIRVSRLRPQPVCPVATQEAPRVEVKLPRKRVNTRKPAREKSPATARSDRQRDTATRRPSTS